LCLKPQISLVHEDREFEDMLMFTVLDTLSLDTPLDVLPVIIVSRSLEFDDDVDNRGGYHGAMQGGTGPQFSDLHCFISITDLLFIYTVTSIADL
jgi:hypothetical protein